MATNKIGVALFGPEPLANFPEPSPVNAVAAAFSCSSSDFVSGTGTALIERGACFFSTKAANAQAAGYDSYIVFNDAARGDALINMSAGTGDVITIPGIFIGHTLGTAMAAGTTVTVDTVAGVEDGEGFMRVFDVTDPANFIQIGTYATECTLPPENVLAMGTRDAHNVVVDGDLAYWAWFYEGVLPSTSLTARSSAMRTGTEGRRPTTAWSSPHSSMQSTWYRRERRQPSTGADLDGRGLDFEVRSLSSDGVEELAATHSGAFGNGWTQRGTATGCTFPGMTH